MESDSALKILPNKYYEGIGLCKETDFLKM